MAYCHGEWMAAPCLYPLDAGPSERLTKVRENLGDRGCGSEREAAVTRLLGEVQLKGSSPFPLSSPCAPALQLVPSPPWASLGWPPPLSSVAPEMQGYAGPGCSCEGWGVHHIPEVTHLHCTRMHGSRGLCSSPPSGFIVHLPSLCSGLA